MILRALLYTVGLLTLASPAFADCETNCGAMLVLPDCSAPPTGTWPGSQAPRAIATCTQCCTGGGDDAGTTCTEAEMPAGQLSIVGGNGQAVAGSFSLAAGLCGGQPVLVFSAKLAPGTYTLAWQSGSPAPFPKFTVAGSQACQKASDCPDCQDCQAGVCGGLAPVACGQNADCGAGQVCLQSSQGACHNLCATAGSCLAASDCASCQACSAGKCVDKAPPACTQNADCGAGKVCAVDPAAACKNACVTGSPVPTCQIDADCGKCTQCASGACSGALPVACTQDADCGSGKACQVVAGAPCQNTCVATTKACSKNADCGPCVTCQGGTCSGQAPATCTLDAHCGSGFVCQISPVGPCQNACVAPTACNKASDCGTCQICAGGKCTADLYVPCSSDAGCGPGYECQQVPGAACQNKCVATASCSSDADCPACTTCQSGGCTMTGTPVCTQNADCPAGQVCQTVPGAACQNQCTLPPCQSSADCAGCTTCVGGTCSGQGVVACQQDGDCGAGKLCSIDAKNACKNECIAAPACTVDGDCGPCGQCQLGTCGSLPAACLDDAGCAAGQVCEVVAGAPCQNQCVTLPVGADGGVPVIPDAGSTDTDAATGTDAAAGTDVGNPALVDTGTAAQDGTGPADTGTPADTGGPGPQDAGATEAGAPEDDAATDEEPETPVARKADGGCTAAPAAAGPGALGWLAVGLVGVVVRRRARAGTAGRSRAATKP